MNQDNFHSENLQDDQQSFTSGFNSDLTELELLRSEIESLQFELAERDRQISEASSPTSNADVSDNAELEELVQQFEARMKDMAQELEHSEEKIRTLNDLLQAVEEANLAERDERHHMEKWLAEIEGRLGESDQALKLEVEQLKDRSDRKDELLSRAEDQIRKMVAEAAELAKNGQQDQQQSQRALELDAKVQQLEREIEDLLAEIASLQTQNASMTADSEQVRDLQQTIATLEMEAAKERAQISRERVELQAAKDEMMEMKREVNRGSEADHRIRAMREHLKEIHETEERSRLTDPDTGGGITARISKLLGRV